MAIHRSLACKITQKSRNYKQKAPQKSLVVSKITIIFASQNQIIVELKNDGMNNIESNTGEIVM